MKVMISYKESNIVEILEVSNVIEKQHEYILLHEDNQRNLLKEYINKSNAIIQTIKGENQWKY